MGFTAVYHYQVGKADWLACGLPREGKGATVPTVGDLARHEFVTCAPQDRIEDVRQRVRAASQDECLVIYQDVLVGRLRATMLDGDGAVTAAEVMESGPATVRANEPLPALIERMQKRNVVRIVVTTPTGRLLGVLLRADAEKALHEQLNTQVAAG